MSTREISAYMSINGTACPVLECSATQTSGKQSGQFSATLALDDIDTAGVEDDLATGDSVSGSLSVLVDGEETVLSTGDIDEANFNLAERHVLVSGRDKSAKLHEQRSSEKFNNKTSSDIISDIAGRVGLSAQTSSTSLMQGNIFQIDYAKMTNNVSLGALMHKVVEFEGGRWYVKGDQLVFKGADDQGDGSSIDVQYFADGASVAGNMVKLDISRKIPLKSPTVTVKSWHTKKKQVLESTAGDGSGQSYTHHIPNKEQDHVDKHAKSKEADYKRHHITVSVEMPGDPSVDVSQTLTLSGTKFDGDYEIDKITHKVSTSGYVMEIEAKVKGDSAS